MNYFTHLKLTTFLLIFFYSISLYAQVGINTTAPNGALEVSSDTTGVVFPRVALTSTNVALPVVNPNGGGVLVPGTTVFNTNSTSTGANDVYIGKYYWNGSQWVEQFDKRQSQLFEQDRTISPSNPNNDAIGYRVSANVGYQDIYGLDSQTFTANFTGTYRVEGSLNYGPGILQVPDNGSMSAVGVQGMFRLTFDGVDHMKYVNPITIYNDAYSAESSINYFALYNEPTIIFYITLTAGTTYTFNLAFDQWGDDRLINSGNSGTGRGIVGVNSPSTIEITYLGD